MIQQDQPELWPVKERRVLGRGYVSSFVEEDITAPSGEIMTRQYLTHPGAVAVVAWDDEDRIVVIDQYRHPVAHRLVEIPAGLFDRPEEDPLTAAQRELAEETELAAEDWRVLVDIFTTPGGCAEGLRIFLARGLSLRQRPEGFVVAGEEAHMQAYRLPRQDLIDGIYAGRLSCPSLIAGLLALETVRLSGQLEQLRPADAVWPGRAELADRL